jgi:YD repeat-containing protein
MPFYCHLISTVTTQQRITEQVFDAQGRVVKTILPDGSSTQTEYDAQGRVSAEIDALNQRRDLTYDASGRLSQVQLPAIPDPLNNNVSTRPTCLYEYNAQGRMTKCYGPNCRRTFGRIKTLGICLPIWRVDRIVENSGEAEADGPLGSWWTMCAVTHVTQTAGRRSAARKSFARHQIRH